MAGLQPGDSAHHGVSESGTCNSSHDRLEERDKCSSNWYMIRKEIEEDSPSRKDGIDLKKEAYFRKSYCTFLQDLGMRLKVPQVTIATAIIFCHRFFLRQSHAKNERRVTIATAIIFCHRFFLRQSHAKNERRTVATICMFLAGKVEETPRPLKDVILVSYEIIHKKDPAAVQRIKQKEEYEKQKELILLGERVVLATLGFDLNVHHPYKPLVEAIKKFKVAQNALAQVAWNFVNDGLRTSLCLQFKPHHIAAGAIFLAAKFLKVKLPSDGDKVWWQEFDVTPRQLEEVSNQMLELYEQNRLAPPPQSNGSEADVSDGGANNTQRSLRKTSATEEQPTSSVNGFSSQVIVSKPGGSSTARQSIESDSQRNSVQNPADCMNAHKEWDCANTGNHHLEKTVENGEMNEGRTALEGKEEKPAEGVLNGGSGGKASTKGSSDVIKRIDKEKVKAALEKRRKSRAEDLGKEPDVMDDYDIIERELENGVEMAERERKQKKSINSSKAHSVRTNRVEADHNYAEASERFDRGEGLGREAVDTNDNAEEGELSSLDVPAHPPREHLSPMSNSRKRKAELSLFNREVRPDYYHDMEHSHRNYRQEPSHV